ncbi:hypothetical protein PR001_g29443 [Phytophthora rubi]|uniref:Peptidase S33 tripeptidyl aminopeptidase-like C-terminal domain-containing protein n=1 Tax=Phytophthora rubi TaxID=129364 RepID=A0A6A3H154_9STRA|nr:hypothetical protein PR001_g29443 [Phytophthora rubi]
MKANKLTHRMHIHDGNEREEHHWQISGIDSKESTKCQLPFGNYEANGIIYKRDEYWNKSATIPTQASVLLLSSKQDPQTPHKYAEYLLDALHGDKKELITFEFATHGTLWTTPLDESDENSETCGMKLLVSYVSSGGDLDGLDKTCVDNMPVFSLTPSITYQYYFLSTNNAYDGVYNASLAALVTSSSSGSGTNTLTTTAKENETYKTVFIVFLVLFVVSSTIAVFFTYRWYQLKHHKAANRDTDDLPDNISISTPAEVASSSPELASPFSTHRVS